MFHLKNLFSDNRRVVLVLLLGISATMLPWWVTCIGMGIALLHSSGEEIIVAAILTDLLYGGTMPFVGMEGWVTTALACTIYAVAAIIRHVGSGSIRWPRIP